VPARSAWEHRRAASPIIGRTFGKRYTASGKNPETGDRPRLRPYRGKSPSFHLNYLKAGVPSRLRCPRCGAARPWLLRDGRRRCIRCRYDWRPGRLPLRLTAQAWRELLQWFVRGAPSAQIAHETGLDRKRVLRALTAVRQAIMRSRDNVRRLSGVAPESQTTEAQEVGPRKSAEHLRPRFPAIGLYVAHGLVGAEIIPGGEAEQLGPLLRARKTREPVALPPEWHGYAAVVYRGRFYRLAPTGHSDAAFGRIEAFWAYLQRQLRAKGGIRRERLELYVAEYVWRYNRRQLSRAEQVKEIVGLLREQPAGGSKRTYPERISKASDSGFIR
jgi:transposase